MKHFLLAGLCILLGLSMKPSLAFAAPLNFDCDVPSDHYSSVSQEADASTIISGTVRLVEMRAGKYLPLAGAKLENAEGNKSVGLQIVAASDRALQFDVILNLNDDGEQKRYLITRVEVKEAITFKLYMEGSKIIVAIGSDSVASEIAAFPVRKAMIYCSTAQFKFSDLLFAAQN
jgi:hypothetical protein